MSEIWANRLIAGTKAWDEVPFLRKGEIKTVLGNRVENNTISAEQYEAITGETYT